MSSKQSARISIAAPWLHKPWFDLVFFLSPSLLSIAAVLAFKNELDNTTSLPLWAWVVFVLGIDVSHVYSTLFRTYFDSNEYRENKNLLTMIPIIVWGAGVFLYSISPKVFWSTLAYLAVFHFVRQQYGFMKLYARKDSSTKWSRRIDAMVIYFATFYPIIYWHAHLPRNFHWFIDGDFLMGLPPVVERAAFPLYVAGLAAYVLKELIFSIRERSFNLPKNLIVLGTVLSWYVGIVLFNGDMIFTITNIVTHGIPYMALVWVFGRKKQLSAERPATKFIRFAFSRAGAALFVSSLLLFAYLEEGLWAGLVWREHFEVFGVFSWLPAMTDKGTLAWLVPLLSLPQTTHYVLDGFIWKLRNQQASWQKVIFDPEQTQIQKPKAKASAA